MDKTYFKKSLGQNFLTNKNIRNKILNLIDPETKNILEIGSGHGFLTSEIIKFNYKLLIIEKDRRFENKLNKLLINTKNNSLLLTDILSNNIQSRINDFFNNEEYLVIGNLPYNISSQIIYNFSFYTLCKKMIFMLQDDFVIKLNSKKNNFYTLFIKNYWNITKNFNVNKENFYPQPKIESCVANFVRKDNPDKIFDDEEFIKFLKIAFLHKRKTLVNNLKEKIPKIKDILIKSNISLNIRAEDVSIKNFKNIYNLHYIN